MAIALNVAVAADVVIVFLVYILVICAVNVAVALDVVVVISPDVYDVGCALNVAVAAEVLRSTLLSVEDG